MLKQTLAQTTTGRLSTISTKVIKINRHYYSGKTTKQSNEIIHVRIRPSDNRSINDHSNIPSTNRNITTSGYLFENFQSKNELSTIYNNDRDYNRKQRIITNRYLSISSKVAPHKNLIIKNHSHLKTNELSSDQYNLTKEHHKKPEKNTKKKSRTYRCFIISSLVSILLIAITIAIVLPILLLKSETTTTKTASLRWNTTGITVAGISGVGGRANNQLNTPYDAVVDYSYTLYVVDQGNNRVQKYMRNNSVGTTIAGLENGTAGSSSNQLNSPANVLVDFNGNLYITDILNNRVQYWPNGSSTGTTIAGNATGVAGNSNNLLYSPYGMARDLNTGTLYIADYDNHRIMSYASGASSGVVVAGGNGSGLNNTQLYNPIGLHFDSLSNSLLIANYGSNTVVRWVLGDSNWTLLAGGSNGLSGNTSTLLRNPRDVTLDPMGNMYILDRSNHRVQLYMAGESVGKTIAGVSGIYGNDSNLLNTPRSVELDSQLNLYISDRSNHRIQKFVRY
ncbi:unnamed protein product [Rotaria sordida]|uniref:NHL repeat-containing protein n=1 Tax=Rotaria sordida TaxID=392033 RepID=A0A818ZWZ4_9BILA|nr:unnamed protein product [Rotaria sordida]CAF3837216.1 unnamed protein product [Rotaria sordida]